MWGLCYTDRMKPHYGWVDEVKARGLGDALSIALDALEPLGPLGAQALFIAQPFAGLFGAAGAVGDLAQALEEPGGVEALRRLLDDESQGGQ